MPWRTIPSAGRTIWRTASTPLVTVRGEERRVLDQSDPQLRRRIAAVGLAAARLGSRGNAPLLLGFVNVFSWIAKSCAIGRSLLCLGAHRLAMTRGSHCFLSFRQRKENLPRAALIIPSMFFPPFELVDEWILDDVSNTYRRYADIRFQGW